jgi:hypothetical protein
LERRKKARKKYGDIINSDEIRMRVPPMFFEVGWLHDLSLARAIDDMSVSLAKTFEASQQSADSTARVRDSVHSTEEIAKLVEEHARGLTTESERLEGRIRQFLDSVKAA